MAIELLRASLENLPVELVHRIFDYLDSETILHHIRYVSKRFCAIADSYNRHYLNFQSISKDKFHRICKIVNWSNVYSIVLSDDNQTPGQIDIFLSTYSFSHFLRLRSMTLINIEDSHLKTILDYVATNCRLHRISIAYADRDSKSDIETNYLTLFIRHPTLRKLDLTMRYDVLDKLNWPNECFIEHLRLSNNIDFNMYCNILRHSPYLKTIAIQGCNIYEYDMKIYCTTSEINIYEQLASLSFENSILEFDQLEFLLSLTPCLIHLRLKSSDVDLLNGLRWEQFIQAKLPQLRQFEFSFHNDINSQSDNINLESIMDLFQTSFWQKINHGYITLVKFHQLQCMSLHSIPLIGSALHYYPNSSKTLCSNAPATLSNAIKMKNIRELHLNLIELLTDNNLEKNGITNEPLFPKVNKLLLVAHGDLPIHALDLVLNFVDFTCITELVLDFDSLKKNIEEEFFNIRIFLENFQNLQSLIIKHKFADIKTHCSIVPCHVRHLQVDIEHVDEAITILERFSYLSSIVFHSSYKMKYIMSKIINYLTMEKRDFTYNSSLSWLKLWLGNIKLNF